MRRIVLVLVFSMASCLSAQTPVSSNSSTAASTRTDADKRAYKAAMEEADKKIAAEVKAHSELMKNLEYLCYRIGPRLTGSPQMQAASAWTLSMFKDYGIDAHLETVQISHSWTRGRDTAALIAPLAMGVTSRNIEVRSAGWSKATPGEITATVVVVPMMKSQADVDAYLAANKGKFTGKVVLSRPPSRIPADDENMDNAYDSVIPPQSGVPQTGVIDARGIARLITTDAPAAILNDSGKNHSLFNMGGAGARYSPSETPTAFVTHEDYAMIYKLASEGEVQMKLNLAGKFSDGPVDASITVAEIKGTEFPDERVIVGGHLDSWDLGQGAVDNGTGAMSVLEAARALKALGWKPKRTITFILFTGEENGGVGAQTFLTNHAAELDKVDGILVNDLGTGKVFTITMENAQQWNVLPLSQEVYTPLQEVFGMNALDTRFYGSSDHIPFMRKGVPTFFTLPKVAQYREAHHSQTDTFDKVVPATATEQAAIVAAWAWNMSEMPERFPHHPATEAPPRQ